MRRLASLLVVFVMSVSFSGISGLVFPEPCSIDEASAAVDTTCPPSCVRCGCCSQPIVASLTIQLTSAIAVVADEVAEMSAPPAGDPRDILHVPKATA